MLQPVRTIIVVQNRILREGVRIHLGACEDIQLLEALETGKALPTVYAALRPELVLIDLDLPDALDSIRGILDIEPAAWIIGLAIYEAEEHCVAALAAGVSTVVPKDLIGNILVTLILAGRPAQTGRYERPSVEELPEPSLLPQRP